MHNLFVSKYVIAYYLSLKFSSKNFSKSLFQDVTRFIISSVNIVFAQECLAHCCCRWRLVQPELMAGVSVSWWAEVTSPGYITHLCHQHPTMSSAKLLLYNFLQVWQLSSSSTWVNSIHFTWKYIFCSLPQINDDYNATYNKILPMMPIVYWFKRKVAG